VLNTNCRNAGAIYDMLKSHYRGQDFFCGTDPKGGHVESRKVREQDVPDLLEAKIRFLLDAGLDPSDMVILGRHRFEGTCLSHRDQLGGVPMVHDILERDKGILYSPYSAFKGLESDVVFMIEVIAACEKFSESVFANGVGRARQQLYIYRYGQ